MAPQSDRVHGFCRRILECGDLAQKLAPPPRGLADDAPGPALRYARPARAPGLTLSGGAERLPRPSELHDADARARCLARFAHHELMAVELFAWALLRWPELPGRMRREMLQILADEQRHCTLYLGRLAAHGSRLECHPRSDYFWRHVPTIEASPHGPRAFLCAMGLTLEQANLDFSGLYRDAFRAAGDAKSAAVCDRVQRDEIRHVRHAVRWLRELSRSDDELRAYREAVPFPFGATRAKGRRFDADARRRAGLSAAFIEAVRTARAKPADAPR